MRNAQQPILEKVDYVQEYYQLPSEGIDPNGESDFYSFPGVHVAPDIELVGGVTFLQPGEDAIVRHYLPYGIVFDVFRGPTPEEVADGYREDFSVLHRNVFIPYSAIVSVSSINSKHSFEHAAAKKGVR